jgi:putative acetyltransferase
MPATVGIVGFRAELAGAFEALNRAWIERYFVVEAADLEAFRNPEAIVRNGGAIFFVIEDQVAVGTCAIIRLAPDRYELAKMAVRPESQGRGYGDLLIDAAVSFARDAGGRTIMLESNSRLAPAIRLYEKHGFRHVPIEHAHGYARVDVQMELRLDT